MSHDFSTYELAPTCWRGRNPELCQKYSRLPQHVQNESFKSWVRGGGNLLWRYGTPCILANPQTSRSKIIHKSHLLIHKFICFSYFEVTHLKKQLVCSKPDFLIEWTIWNWLSSFILRIKINCNQLFPLTSLDTNIIYKQTDTLNL